MAVLWTVALLSALVMATSVTFREFAGIVTIDRDRLRAEALLTAGLETAAGVMARWPDDRPLYANEMAFQLSTGAIRVRVSDEAGRIDIGKAPVEVLTSLFSRINASNPDGLARSVVDWRIANGGKPPTPKERTPAPQNVNNANAAAANAVQNQPTATTGQQPNGTNQPGQAKPKDQNSAVVDMPFSDIRQLLNVPGVTPDLVAAAAPFITVFGGDKLNALTASPQVLASLPGMDPMRLAGFIEARRNFTRDAKDAPHLTQMLGTAEPYVDIAGRRKIASVVVQARVSDGYAAAAQAVIILFPQDVQPYRVLTWNPWPAALAKW